jgi:N6-adenosine-specific RNA methylase IME4
MNPRPIKPDISMIGRAFTALRPAGGFPVILADPCWYFGNYSERGQAKNAIKHYDCMLTEDIMRLPVHLLAADDCALFIWVTWPMLADWLKVIEAWGFEYAGLAWEWIKYNPETGLYAFGPGYGSRKNLEPCLLATRGNPSLRRPLSFFGVDDARGSSHSVRDFIQAMPYDCIRAPRREHSRKPDEQYDRIEQMFDGPYVELFARSKCKGWTSWGKEAERFNATT